MITNDIIGLIDKIKLILDISDKFEYIGYEIPKQAKTGDILIIGDLDEGGNCFETNLIEFRIIGKADQTALKIRSYTDLLNSNILGDKKLGFNKISKFDESRIFINSDKRFEKVITYKIY